MPDETHGEASIRAYFREISEYPLLTRSEELELARLVAAGDENARDRLIVCNLRLVIKIAHEFKGYGLPIQDVIAYGNAGLIAAAEKFNAEKSVEFGTKFSSYASWWIKKEIRKALAECGNKALVMIKSTKRSRAVTFGKKREMLKRQLGREPTCDELVEATGRTKRMVKILQEVERINFVYLDDENHCRKHDGKPDKEMLRRQNAEHIHKAMECLDERERKIITLKFSLDNGPERTLGEIGEEVGLTGERVRQIVGQAIVKLKGRMHEMETRTK